MHSSSSCLRQFVEGWPGPYSNGTGVGAVNTTTFEWVAANLPLFETSDQDMQSAYYFRSVRVAAADAASRSTRGFARPLVE